MGFESSSLWLKKKDVINDLLKSIERSQWKVLDQASTSSGAYFYIHTPNGSKFIYCALIKKKGNSFFLKTTTEASGPASVDCPERFLSYEKTCGQYSDQWRKAVQAFHDAKKSTLLGKIIQYHGKTYKVLYKLNRSYIIQLQGSDLRYKLGPKSFASVQVLEKEVLKEKVLNIE